MQETIISQQRTLGKVTLEGRNRYFAYITAEPCKTGKFRIKLEFTNLDADGVTGLFRLFNLSRPLRFKSDVLERRDFNIANITINKFFADSKFAITWECFSSQSNFSP